MKTVFVSLMTFYTELTIQKKPSLRRGGFFRSKCCPKTYQSLV